MYYFYHKFSISIVPELLSADKKSCSHATVGNNYNHNSYLKKKKYLFSAKNCLKQVLVSIVRILLLPRISSRILLLPRIFSRINYVLKNKK